MIMILLIILVIFLLGGGLGVHYGSWGGPNYSSYGMGGIGLGGILLLVLVVLLLSGRL